MRLFQAGIPYTSKGDRDTLAQGVRYGQTNFLSSYGHSNKKFVDNVLEDLRKLELYQAGSFAGNNQRNMLYSTGPQNILFSFGHKTATDTCDLVTGEEGKERMRLFLAGDWQPALHEKVCDAAGETNLLCTNAAKNSRDRADYFATKRTDYNILVDSGAFTAWKQGKPIVLSDYIDYAMELSMKATCKVEFIGLDVIAGTPERGKAGLLTKEELEEACEQGFKNYLEMNPIVPCIPTFHRDDDWKWLYAICDAVKESESKRMCLAPRVDGSPTSVKMRWLNECFTRMVERYGREVWKSFKIHGLGISSIEMMEAYPFYSVDSTAWLWAATNCTLRVFDGSRMLTFQKTASGENNGWGKSVQMNSADERSWRIATTKTIQSVDHYRTQKEGADNALVGGYWFGAQAIAADVRLQRYITALWESRGVRFDD